MIASVTAVPASVAAAEPAAVECRAYESIPVSSTPGTPKTLHVWGELCARPEDLVNGHTVQLLLHGAFYNHSYWNPSYDNGSHSYARSVATAGVPTFSIDRIGQGRSSRPPSTELTVQNDAFVVHQIVQELKRGAFGNTGFGPVVAVGHSAGSAVAWQEAATYHDIQGLIVTGMLHVLPVGPGVMTAGANYRPAALDPAFRTANLDPGYLTTAVGSRGQVFHHAGGVDPGIVAWDEANKDATSAAEIAGIFPSTTSDLTRSIHVPVLVIQGQQDLLMCGPGSADCSSAAKIQELESRYYSPESCLQTVLVPDAGHDIALSNNRKLAEDAGTRWTTDFIGTDGQGSAAGGCG
ncbi:alpha/beta hydrolase [Nocardia sp. NPDC019395]|uniref:alpha/beta hydrolase n=1 Tax=Nocardia sp. NPDC019395 TaxID=3154686 RepID=UPI0033E485B6